MEIGGKIPFTVAVCRRQDGGCSSIDDFKGTPTRVKKDKVAALSQR